MARYKLLLKTSATREIEAVSSKRERQRILDRISGLADDPRPHGSQKLVGHHDRYRVRQGSYRIVYSVDDESHVVTVVKVGHRSEVYD